jgi:hypothetical protein
MATPLLAVRPSRGLHPHPPPCSLRCPPG